LSGRREKNNQVAVARKRAGLFYFYQRLYSPNIPDWLYVPLMQKIRNRRHRMLSREELIQMRDMSFEEIDEREVPDIRELDIDVRKSKQEKILSVLAAGKNPYFIKSGEVLVKIGFASTSRTIEDALESLVGMKW